MRGDFDEDEDPYFEPDDNECPRCDGEGAILVCIDDMCRGAGECFHGDGYAPCPQCCTQPSEKGSEMKQENTSVLAPFIEDPYASGRFENLGSQGLPDDVYNELLRVAADKHVSVYYLAAIYKRGQADALAAEDDGDSYLWERCYACGHRLAFASDSCPQCNEHFKDGDDPPNWPEKCDCPRCTEARKEATAAGR